MLIKDFFFIFLNLFYALKFFSVDWSASNSFYLYVQTEKPVGRFLSASAPLDHFPPNPYKELSPGPTYIRPIVHEPKMIGPAQFYIPFPKKPGGNFDGCFDKFPKYSSDPYDKDITEQKVEGVFISGGPPMRTKYTNSIIHQVTDTSCNATNYMDYQPQVYPLDKWQFLFPD